MNKEKEYDFIYSGFSQTYIKLYSPEGNFVGHAQGIKGTIYFSEIWKAHGEFILAALKPESVETQKINIIIQTANEYGDVAQMELNNIELVRPLQKIEEAYKFNDAVLKQWYLTEQAERKNGAGSND